MANIDPRIKFAWLSQVCIAVALVWLLIISSYFAISSDTWANLSNTNLSFTNIILWAIVLSVISILLSYLVFDLLSKAFKYDLTDKEIIVQSGIIARNSTILPYDKIRDVSIARSGIGNRIEQLFGIFTLKLETMDKKTIEIPGITDPMEKIRIIMRSMQEKQMKRDDSKPVAGSTSPPAEGEKSDVVKMQEVLEELKNIKKLLEENKLGKKKKALDESMQIEKDKLNIFTKITKNKNKPKK